MHLAELQIQNFGIIKEADLIFGQSQSVIGLVGRYEEEGRSNRAGKTTLIEAIKYLLFGKARSRHHTKLINRAALKNDEGLYIRGLFLLDTGEDLEIVRVRSSDGRPSAAVDGIRDLSWSETNEKIVEKIGFTYDEFLHTCYFGQGDIHQFMNSTPKDKRVLLLEWLNQTRWESRHKYAKENAKRLEEECKTIQITLDAMPDFLEDISDLKEELTQAEENIKEFEDEYLALEEKLNNIKKLESQLDEQDSLIDTKEEIINKIKELEANLEKAEKDQRLRKEYDDKIDKISNEVTDLSNKYESKVKGCRDELFEIIGEMKAVEKSFDKLDGLDGVCPVISESCNRVSSDVASDIAGKVNELKQDRIKTRNKMAAIESESRQALKPLSMELTKIKGELEQISNTKPDYFEKQLDKHDDLLEEVSEKIEPLKYTWDEVLNIKVSVESQRSEIDKNVGKFSERIQALKREISKTEKFARKQKNLQGKLERLQIDKGAWTYCSYMFGDRGIPAEYIKNSFSALEGDINRILDRMGSGLSVEFKPYRESKTWEKHCVSCGKEWKGRKPLCKYCGEERQRKRIEQLVLNIHDASEGTVSDFSLDSGGGKTLISFAVRLALLFLKIREGSGQVPPIVLDEIVGSLDPVNRAAVIDVVVNMLKEDYGIQQIFWISHNEEILDMIEDVITVTRYGDHSIADWI
jgi:DNA repair exonuclease SbcCD ATPase subunit